jgi:hypothetical protein
MNSMRIPYKLSLQDTNVSYFEISASWAVSNPNPYPVYIDSYFRLIHKGGGYSLAEKDRVRKWIQRTTGIAQDRYERVWFWYQPLRGVVIDFSQKKTLPEEENNMGTERITFASLGVDGGLHEVEATQERINIIYLYAPDNFVASPNVRSELKSLQSLPARFRGSYTATLRIPGPEASLGMTKFWNSQDSPDFDIEVRPVVFPYWDARDGEPSLMKGAEEPVTMDRVILKNAFELDVKKGRQQARKSDSYDVDWYRGD